MSEEILTKESEEEVKQEDSSDVLEESTDESTEELVEVELDDILEYAYAEGIEADKIDEWIAENFIVEEEEDDEEGEDEEEVEESSKASVKKEEGEVTKRKKSPLLKRKCHLKPKQPLQNIANHPLVRKLSLSLKRSVLDQVIRLIKYEPRKWQKHVQKAELVHHLKFQELRIKC